MEERENTEK